MLQVRFFKTMSSWAAVAACALPFAIPGQHVMAHEGHVHHAAQPAQPSAHHQAQSAAVGARVRVESAWARATVPHQPASGAFMVLHSEQDQKLVAASSPVAKSVELHEMRMEGDIMRMRQVSSITLPAGATVALQPGGYHIMLIGLHQQLRAGEKVPLTLVLEAPDGRRSTVEVQAEVRALSSGAAQHHGHGNGAGPEGGHGLGDGQGHGERQHGEGSHGEGQGHGMAETVQPHQQHQSTNHHQALPVLPASVEIKDCWVRALPTPLPAAGYLQIRNRSQDELMLQAVAAPGFAHVMLHDTVTENGMAKMVHQEAIAVPAGASVALAPGGLHIMLEQARQPLQVGSSVPLSLLFRGYAPREVSCEVRSARG